MSFARVSAGVLLAALFTAVIGAQQSNRPSTAPMLGDHPDGSRARPVHRIPLRDPEGEVIHAGDRPLLPFSVSQTCGGACHDIGAITRGWHFSVGVAGSPGGRRGEPWILIDTATATQLPLSNHAWPGTFTPEQAGVTSWQFAKQFGGRTAGQLTGDAERRPDLRTRWIVSGALEPNCLACHDASPAYDHAEYARQIGLENFRWAAAAASGLAVVTGTAKDMPNVFDYLMPTVEDDLRPRMPALTYATGRFLPDAKVVFDIVREVPASRCYFCHSTIGATHTDQQRWMTDVDVHMARGMTCVDCHRSGLDHAMARGDGGEANTGAPALSCRGCHMPDDTTASATRGRLGAPVATHNGLPPVHFQKLSCTACHSGPRPEAAPRQVKTSLAHRLGGLNVNRAEGALPHLYDPIFAKEDDGVTTPNRLVWPAFWGTLTNGSVTPLPIDRVKAAMTSGKVVLPASPDGSWAALDDEVVGRVLRLLQTDPHGSATAVYVSGGRLHRLDAAGRVSAEEQPAAQPYLWPIAHDVRPAASALGARGCDECHSDSAAMFFGQVAVDSPLASDRRAAWTMARFQKDRNASQVIALAGAFRYRPQMKAAVVVAASLLLLFVASSAASAMRRFSAATLTARRTRMAANLIAVGLCTLALSSGFQALLSSGPLTGNALLVHVGSGPWFVAGVVLVALFWAHRNRLGDSDWNRLRLARGDSAPTPVIVLLRKIAFWIALGAAVPAVVSVTLALFPLGPSAWQSTLIAVHRYSAAVLLGAAGVFVVCALLAWVRRSPDA